MNDSGDTSTGTVATATLAGGCFWCLEAVYQELAGVRSVESGYTGGHVERPSYQQVCTGTTGHAEAVRVRFEPDTVAYRDLLEVFFSIHDPTTKDRQGHDVGPQYRSAIFVHDAAQRAVAKDVMAEVAAAGLYDAPLVTEIVEAGTFYPAEPYHRDFFLRNPEQAYCRAVIAPKVAKFRKQHLERLRRSPTARR